jgi:hypothetical protein
MTLPTLLRTARATPAAIFAMLLAVVVTVTGVEASAHGHLPATDGWHDATPHGATASDEGLNTCSICRLAHETASAPVAPGTVSEPLRLVAPHVKDRSVPALVLVAREHSPRAPPCLATC